MRAARIPKLGSPPHLEEIEAPARAAGHALLAPTAVPLNPIDIATSTGVFYGGSPPTPYTPGSEGVARIVESDALAEGTRVYVSGDGLGRTRDGTLAEQAVVAEEIPTPIPDEVSDEVAGACGTAGLSGWLPVVWRARTGPEDRVLVLGATGTVGLAAVQAARIVGAQVIVAAGRRPENLEVALDAGATAAVRLDEGDLAAKLREAGLERQARIEVFDPDQHPVLAAGSLSVEPFRVTHSIPDAVGFGIDSPGGLIVHTSDFKFDPTPVDGKPTDYGKIEEFGRRGVRLLISDSVHIETRGETPSERVNVTMKFGLSSGRLVS